MEARFTALLFSRFCSRHALELAALQARHHESSPPLLALSRENSASGFSTQHFLHRFNRSSSVICLA
jgi:hypothetical protein